MAAHAWSRTARSGPRTTPHRGETNRYEAYDSDPRVLAVELGATAEQVVETMHVHPTLPESVDSAAGGVHGPS